MKHLSIRLSSPAATSLASRLTQFSARKMNQIMAMPQRLIGKWRLLLNYCPECNSCAPKMHQCDVCKADTKAYFSWNKEVERTWWQRFTDKHNLAA